ncbi:TetR/AcrR family transcriptional regulator [Streptomyces kronopolitis]|uniref:TetR/AcrR family transcriptional regulator n=1 Tax=Streptomyces kronopolitis TaxID=1612435 RepID=UPI0020C0833D|nr:TetR/AcrR family transcriptional regulator [Streptomyces kronopolitis]MCL6300647.1 TetR/AcrR family transcriptional regulator [Streptomyces kronopolitis]
MTDDAARGERHQADNSAPAPGTRRPGGRTARTRAAVRDAVLAGLTEYGYPGLTVEYVAEHSGVHKTTLYRRWKDVEGLLADALDLAGEDTWAPPDTGSLEGDLRALAHEVVASFADPAVAASGSAMIAAGFRSERAAAALRGYYAERFARCEVLVERAVRRGELPAPADAAPGAPADTPARTDSRTDHSSVRGAIDAGALVRSISAPLFFRLFITREPVGAAQADQAAAAALAAARAGAFTTDSTTADAAGSAHGTDS